MYCRAAAAIAFVIGCSGPRPSDDDAEVVLRVSAVAGLSKLEPGIESSGSTAAAMDLVYTPTDRYVESMKAQGDRVILVRRESTAESSEQLSRVLRGKELMSARALDERRIEARFADDRTAALVAQYDGLAVDTGPFRVERQDERSIRLVSRGETAIDAIEIVASSRADEWRKLLAHELDVIPWASSLYRSQFTGIGSIRVLDIPPVDTAALYFNVRSPVVADAAVRRRIAASIRHEPLARIACGEVNCAAAPVTSSDSSAELPRRMVVMVPQDDTPLRIAAKILRHQLFQVGIELDIDPMPLPSLADRFGRADYVLALLPLTTADRRFGFFLSPGHPKGIPMTGFANAEYDAAVDRGDLRAAQEILDREMPVTRLFEIRAFAAVDAAFCGDVTPSASSWLWLSKLHPCEEGEQP